jgi:hypothetical protein
MTEPFHLAVYYRHLFQTAAQLALKQHQDYSSLRLQEALRFPSQLDRLCLPDRQMLQQTVAEM